MLSHLHEIAPLSPGGGEVEVAGEGEPVLSGSSDLDLVGATHISVVGAVAGCNHKHTHTRSDKRRLESPPGN